MSHTFKNVVYRKTRLCRHMVMSWSAFFWWQAGSCAFWICLHLFVIVASSCAAGILCGRVLADLARLSYTYLPRRRPAKTEEADAEEEADGDGDDDLPDGRGRGPAVSTDQAALSFKPLFNYSVLLDG